MPHGRFALTCTASAVVLLLFSSPQIPLLAPARPLWQRNIFVAVFFLRQPRAVLVRTREVSLKKDNVNSIFGVGLQVSEKGWTRNELVMVFFNSSRSAEPYLA